MEYDRFQQNHTLFIIGIIALLISLSLFAFSFYLMPFLLFNWIYDVPQFVLVWREWLRDDFHFTVMGASWIILLLLIIPALVCGYISYFASNYIDNRIYHLVPEKKEPQQREKIKRDMQETLVFLLKILGLVVLVLIAISVLQWILAIPPAAV
ncbi:hypothetical protein [Legionella jordanis]|uniref:Transmembrane protein n=1 Tax=Legionella jordanis TaxID=456 RepID=A0A0W0VAP3_9GAMM|nr:hypothetical protein [Legionella jordanis]KTD17203.1 transmembrane protein [Legionella jordanis]RMX03323.1 hypothetical protein EAW55_07855 [Legionella jordanis]RMX18301.1 hypothetical protein EAS68_09390 [Legionella jordanis]VEH12599.1 transmembrane protein [Legionella jordanis]HAT8713327.1 hypothetical protein [Legionella jordanis]